MIEWQPVQRQLSELKGWDKNPRKISNDKLKQLTESVQQDGYHQRILINTDNTVIGGHQRLKALQATGIESIEVLIPNRKLTNEEFRRINVRDNLNWGEWVMDDLLELNSPEELTDWGFEDLLPLDEPTPLVESETKIDETLVTQFGDVWQLGHHTLICGDATNPETIALLGKADLVFTDPPYNINYQPETRPIGGRARSQNPLGNIANDAMSEESFAEFIRTIFQHYYDIMTDSASIYVCHPDLQGTLFRSHFTEYFKLSASLVWSKNHFSIGRSDYHWQHEAILYGWKKNGSHVWHGDRKQTTVWQVDRDPTINYQHPTQKPIALAEKAIRNSSKAGDVVVDFFGGSGTTLLACEQLGRSCHMIELEPKFCDVIIQRWQQLTGQEATSERGSYHEQAQAQR